MAILVVLSPEDCVTAVVGNVTVCRVTAVTCPVALVVTDPAVWKEPPSAGDSVAAVFVLFVVSCVIVTIPVLAELVEI